MNQYNRLLDPKKDLGKFSGTLAIYLLVNSLVVSGKYLCGFK